MRRQIAASVIPVIMAVAGCDKSVTPGPSPLPTPVAVNTPPPPSPLPPAADPSAERYELELSLDKLGPRCEGVPEAIRHRTYTATLTPTGESTYTVSLSGGTFLIGLICSLAPSHLGCNEFLASRTGNVLDVNLINENDDGHGGHIVEYVPGAGWIELIGTLKGVADNGTMTAQGSGRLWYCRSSGGYPFPCPSFVGCDVGEMRMTFVSR
jgi:hypothetical protein